MNETATILIVDDQDRNLDALEAILSSQAYKLVRARSADEALLALLQRDFAAIVCDIRMPGTSGIELAKMVKQRKRSQHIPILLLTAHPIEEDELLLGYGAGAVDYLSKPINPEVLRRKVNVFVDLFCKTRALAEANDKLAEEVIERQRAQDELRVAKEELEHRVEERTAELVAANRALRESEDRMMLAMQGAAMGVFSHDLRSGKVIWSAALETMFGLPPGESERSFDDLLSRVHADDRQRLCVGIEQARLTHENFAVEIRFRRDDDEPGAADRWMSMVGRFVMDDQGNPVHSVGVATDVTARRLAADELRMLKESAESANRAKDHFLAVLSHELRTPLTPVLATVQEVLRDRRISTEIRERLSLIQRNVELEARLIDDLLDVTRITRGKMELHRTEVDVHQILEHALRTCDADFRGKRITVQLAERAGNPRVFGDRARLLQVFWNLMKNAAKFTPPGQGVEVQTSDAPGDMIRIDVRDTGVGIEPARLDSIFNAFEQGSAKVTRQYGGLGLGLSIGKALVELHGGTISAASEGLGCGACFTVQIPQATVDVPARNGSGAATPKFSQRDRYQSGSPTRLLLIEDHPDTSRVMARLLRDFGYEVTTAGGVADALRVCEAAQHPFNIAVSDIGLPDGSGLDLVRQLRALYPSTAAIALSGFGMEDDRMRSLDAGFAAHLTKPVDLFTLQSVIEQVVNEGANASSE